ncbi:Mycolic acid cyclopropane synthetase [compost metagenome]
MHHWSENLENQLHRAAAMVPEKTLRIWRLYLAGCAYAFEKGWINLHQILAVKPYADGRHDLPWTREDLYR